MTITLEAKALRAAAAEAESVAANGKETIPILANVLLEGDGGGLTIRSTDMDSAFERRVPVAAGEAMRTTVSARLLAAIAGKLPGDGQVSLTLEGVTESSGGSRLTITAGRARFTLPTLPPDEFPLYPEEEWDAEFEIAPAELARIIDSLAFAICTEETRFYLGGLFFHALNGEVAKLRIAATDGHRLARYQLDLPEGAGSIPKAGVIVPRKACATVRRLIEHLPALKDGEAREPIHVSVSAKKIRFELPDSDIVLTSRLIDGTYPDYARVIPAANDKLMKLERAAIREAIERVSAVASEKTRAVKMSFAADLLRLEVSSPEAGSATEELPCSYALAAGGAADELVTGFNSKYLLELLGHLDAGDGGAIAVELGDAGSPSLWRAAEPGPDAPAGPDGLVQLYVLMPLRV